MGSEETHEIQESHEACESSETHGSHESHEPLEYKNLGKPRKADSPKKRRWKSLRMGARNQAQT